MITSSTCVAKSTTASVIESFAASWTPTMLSATRTHDHDHAAHDVPRVRAQRLPEDREVVGDEERRDGDGDDVDEHLRPGCDEADELVERVPREARRAAGLGEARRSLGVGRGRRGEDHARDHEDERRQPERVGGGEAERVVDRGADVPVGGGEERRRAEHALELDLAPAATPGHRGESTPVGADFGPDAAFAFSSCGSRPSRAESSGPIAAGPRRADSVRPSAWTSDGADLAAKGWGHASA